MARDRDGDEPDDVERHEGGALVDLAMRALPDSLVRSVVSLGAPLSRYGGVSPASAAALSSALELAVKPPRGQRRARLVTLEQLAARLSRQPEEIKRWVKLGLLNAPAEQGPPAKWDRSGTDRAELIAYLRQRGVTEQALARANKEGRLTLLVIDEILVHGGAYTVAEAASRAGVPLELAAQIWRALGLPPPDLNQKVFSRRDIAALRLMGALRTVYSDESLIESAAVLGRSMASFAAAEVEMFQRELTAQLTAHGMGEIEVVWRLANLVDLVVPPASVLMEVVHRWHLETAMRSESVVRIEEVTGGLPGQVDLAVGFADLVGFTAESERLNALEIAEVASRFQRIAESALPDHGARLVKSIGDAVMFTAPTAPAAADAGLALIEEVRGDEKIPPCRVGIAYGPVLARNADYFGRTVNLASRLTAAAPTRGVLVALTDAPPDDKAWSKVKVKVARTRRFELRGIKDPVSALEVARA